MRLSVESHKTFQDIKTHNIFQKELNSVYQSLDEGIITVKDNKMEFTNPIAE